MKQKEYIVKWSIELTASSPEDAAKKALEIQRDPNSLATDFRVRLNGSCPSCYKSLVHTSRCPIMKEMGSSLVDSHIEVDLNDSKT